jgi:hypothetical protein
MSTLRQLRTRSIWAREYSWIHSASSAEITLLSAFAGFVVFGTAAMWEWIATREGWLLLPMALVSDVVAGTLAGILIFAVLRSTRERRLAMLRRLKAIREMNHEIRNALELIQLSAYSTHHQQAIATISNAVDRIQWTLREIVSPTAEAEETTSDRDRTP